MFSNFRFSYMQGYKASLSGCNYTTLKINAHTTHYVKSVQTRYFPWFVFSPIWTEYRKIGTRKKLRIWTFLAQWHRNQSHDCNAKHLVSKRWKHYSYVNMVAYPLWWTKSSQFYRQQKWNCVQHMSIFHSSLRFELVNFKLNVHFLFQNLNVDCKFC